MLGASRKGRTEDLYRQGNEGIHAPSDMLFYLAYYSYFGKPYYEVLEKQPGLLFGKIEEEISQSVVTEC